MPPADSTSTTRYPYGRFQFIWWPRRWWRLWPEEIGPYPESGPDEGIIYAWRVTFGPLEVRRWTPNR